MLDNQTGVTSIVNLPPARSPDALSAGVEGASFSAGGLLVTEFSMDPVDRAMERAKVPNADPARFSHIDPTTLKALLEQKSGLKLTFETAELGENKSEVQWNVGTPPDSVEMTLVVVDSHDGALARMRTTLRCVSAPLDVVVAQEMRLGQYSLQGVGGGGYILFVRDNIFIKLTGLATSTELGTIATEVDEFLKAREGGRESIPSPRIVSPQTSRRVKVGETFELVVEVADAGWMTAATDAAVVQLLEVDTANAAFKFYGTAEGTVDVRLVFAHKSTLQTTTATVHVEVVSNDAQAEKMGELHM